MRFALLASVTLAMLPYSANAQMNDAELMNTANALGQILASEKMCGLTYNQAAIEDYITKTIPPDRMDFAGMLQTMTMGADFSQQSMTDSSKTAHCASVKQSATHFGFIQ